MLKMTMTTNFMNPVVTDHLQAAVESVRLAIQEASNTETVLDIQKLLDLVVGLEELIPESLVTKG